MGEPNPGVERARASSCIGVVEQESWWREFFDDVVRRVADSHSEGMGSQFHLHHNSMNPVMASKFMLTGRIAHRSPWI